MRALVLLAGLVAILVATVRAAPRRPTAKPRAGMPEGCTQRFETPACEPALAAMKPVCPATQDEVPVGDLCGREGVTQPLECTYPKGRCRCVHRPYCGGVAPPLVQQIGMTWECLPPRHRGDCPDDRPNPGDRCTPPRAKSCNFVGCGSTTSCTCDKGWWRCVDRYTAPPPSSRPSERGPIPPSQ